MIICGLAITLCGLVFEAVDYYDQPDHSNEDPHDERQNAARVEVDPLAEDQRLEQIAANALQEPTLADGYQDFLDGKPVDTGPEPLPATGWR